VKIKEICRKLWGR